MKPEPLDYSFDIGKKLYDFWMINKNIVKSAIVACLEVECLFPVKSF